MQLRPYQEEAILAIKESFKDCKRQYIEMPTGSGKTITFLKYAKDNHKNILIIVPSVELQKQCYETASRLFDPKQITRKGNGYDEKISNNPALNNGHVHICITNSLKPAYTQRLISIGFDLLILDECHHVQGSSYRRLIESLSKLKDLCILGVTATPDRRDGISIKTQLFKRSFKVSMEKLIEQGYLSDLEGYIVKTNIDISDLDNHNGDFSLSELYKRLSSKNRNEIILNVCKDISERRNLVFCINIRHAQEVSRLLNDNGLKSQAIYGEMDQVKKKQILCDFRSGKINFLCNCQLLTEGFDEPSIDGIVLARPTSSRSLFIQMIGRGLRLYPGKEYCKVVDIVDNNAKTSTFTELLTSEKTKVIEKFRGIRELKQSVEIDISKSIEIRLERSLMLGKKKSDDMQATPQMLKYLEKNNVVHFPCVSFDDGSFLIWMNELKKDMENGND